VKFINLTRRTEIGANCYYLETGDHHLVLDCGMHPKEEADEALPNFKPIGDKRLDAIIISHAHQDHIGTLPVLMRRQPTARVFMTEATGEIGNNLLHNSVNVMLRQREELGTALYPLFTHRETDKAAEQWQFCPTRQRINLAGERASPKIDDACTFEFLDAGHVLGSAGILLRAEGRTFLYTADVNFIDQTIMQAAVFPEEKIDVLIMECTRGGEAVAPGWTRAAEEGRLAAAMNEAFRRGGCILIPVFALGKTQEVLAMLYQFRRAGLMGDFPVYIGGLSSKMTETYDRRASMSRRRLPRVQLMNEIAPFVISGQNVEETPVRPGRIYALSSGMMTPKTLSNIFARRVVEDARHSIFFVGYSDPASPAGVLRRAQPDQEVALDPDQPSQRVRCAMQQFSFSAHADRDSLVAYARKLSPQKIVLVHGDVPATTWMKSALTAVLPESQVIVPVPGVELEL
jgi:Cft2 family RNA processing exonuclease